MNRPSRHEQADPVAALDLPALVRAEPLFARHSDSEKRGASLLESACLLAAARRTESSATVSVADHR